MFSVIKLSDHNQDPSEYLESRLSGVLSQFPESAHSDVLVAFVDHGVRAQDLEVVDKTSISERMWERGTTILKEWTPLLDGEVEESVGLARAPLDRGDCPGAFKFYLVQKTSMAEAAVFIGFSEETNIANDTADDGISAQAITLLAVAKLVGSKIAAVAGSFIWNQVETHILGRDGMPGYFSRMLEEVRNIVKTENIAVKLSELSATAGKFRDAINTYNNMGRSEVQLQAAHDRASDLMRNAAEPYLENEGAFYYGEGAVYFIMVLQEKYKNMKASGATEEELRHARNNISNYARNGADTLRHMRNALHAKRLGMITDVFFHMPLPGYGRENYQVHGLQEGGYAQNCAIIGGCGAPIHISRGARHNPTISNNRFEDRFNGFWMSNHFNIGQALLAGDSAYSWKWVNQWRQHYYAAQNEQTTNQLHPLLEVAGSLDKLATNPVPGLD